MEKILEKARELGALMKESDIVKNYKTAKEAYDADSVIQELVGKFNLARLNLMNESKKDEQDADALAKMQAETQKAYEEIMTQPVMQELDQANMALEDMVKQVNQILQNSISDEPQGCTHDCSTCGGCH